MRHKTFRSMYLDTNCIVVSKIPGTDRLAILDILTSELQISLHYCIY